MNFEQNNSARLLLIAKFAYNNAKNVSIGCIPFEQNCNNNFLVSYEKNINLRFRLREAKERLSKLDKPMTICQENFIYTQDFPKRS